MVSYYYHSYVSQALYFSFRRTVIEPVSTYLDGWLRLTSHRQRDHLETATYLDIKLELLYCFKNHGVESQ